MSIRSPKAFGAGSGGTPCSKAAVSADGVFFSVGHRQMARLLVALRWREWVGVPQFPQLKSRVFCRVFPRTRQGGDSFCACRSDLGMASDLHGNHRREIAEQRSALAQKPSDSAPPAMQKNAASPAKLSIEQGTARSTRAL